jgi:ATP-dependent DNA helicase DinG
MSFALECFLDNGAVARNLKLYEVRAQQLEMVKAVEDAIVSEKPLIVEAGPGVGKSLAYLVPFIHWAVTGERRVVVSTYTKALQNQLFVKDLPFLKDALGLDLRYVICMGSDNYVCLKKAAKVPEADLFEGKYHKRQADKIRRWLDTTNTGLVSDMDFSPDARVWDAFRRESDLCRGRRCSYFDDCFYMSSRREQSKAHILIVNHALLFASMGSEVSTLPEFHALVLDEAHTVEDVATDSFGKQFSSFGTEHLMRKIKLFSERTRELSDSTEKMAGKIDGLEKALADFAASSDMFFQKAAEKLPEKDTSGEFSAGDFPHLDISDNAEKLAKALSEIARARDDDDISDSATAYAHRIRDLRDSILAIFTAAPSGWVFWFETRKLKSGRGISFHASPIDIRGRMRQQIFERVCPVVLTSATLSASGRKGDLTFVKQRLGMRECLELVVESPFDYGKNVLFYFPEGIKDPNIDGRAFKQALKDHIISIHDVMGGRIFALFTSYDMLGSVSSGIAAERPDIYVLKQGDMPRYVLLDVFKKNSSSILMGTTTFWQGVDVPGSSLECVIITRLPFGVPSDPINSARIRAIREDGRNPFSEYQLPQAMIMFKQGFGRLIRSHTDRGVFVVLDPRIRTREYGRRFLDYVPNCRLTSDLNEVRAFFDHNHS